jgi:hypothetical protein
MCLALRYNTLFSAFRAFLFIAISLIIKGAIVSLHAPKKVSRRTTRVYCTYSNPEPPANVLILP